MSIIQEALKKAYNTYSGNDRKESAKKENPSPVPALKTSPIPPRQFLKHTPLPMPTVILATALVIIIAIKIFVIDPLNRNVKSVVDRTVSHQEVTYKALGSKVAAERPRKIAKPEPVSHEESGADRIEPLQPKDLLKVAYEGNAAAQIRKLPQAQAMVQPPELLLNGIMYVVGRPQAIINGSVVEEGDTVSGATVKRITKNNVVLGFNEVEITLKLKE